MQIKLKEITVRELTKGYEDNKEDGVVGYGGRLDIRPPFQREFIYKDKQREAVIDTVTKDYPINVMYWSISDDWNYEVIDGQQRILSICQYINGDFAYNNKYFYNLQRNEKKQILDYKLKVYFCSGTDSEKLEWFRTINIAGEILSNQELLNAVYSGTWVSDAKKYFSKTGCSAYNIASNYMKGSPIRQDYLEEVIGWANGGYVEKYMAKHQHYSSAEELWAYFQDVISWVKNVFPKYRKDMKGIRWGFIYNEFKYKTIDPILLEEEVSKLMRDEEVTNKKGIYTYVLNGKEKHLSIRSFTDNQKIESYERQNGICSICGEEFKYDEMEADHITPWHEGGKTISSNCRMLCKECNRRKSGV